MDILSHQFLAEYLFTNENFVFNSLQTKMINLEKNNSLVLEIPKDLNTKNLFIRFFDTERNTTSSISRIPINKEKMKRKILEDKDFILYLIITIWRL